MDKLKKYRRQSLFGGWTRIELLMHLYEEAITCLGVCKELKETPDDPTFIATFIRAQKAILAIHTGLKPDEYEIAFNVARLLHFALVCLEDRRFSDAIKVLAELHTGFQAIAEEAKQLEAKGEISPLVDDDSLQTIG